MYNKGQEELVIMRLEVTIPNILLMILITFLFSVLLVPLFKKVAFYIENITILCYSLFVQNF